MAHLEIDPTVREIVARALAEDIGTGDVTTLSVVPASLRARAVIVMKSDGVVAGLPIAGEVFSQVDPGLAFRALVADGQLAATGDHVCEISGPARSLLAAERVALNFLQRLSGIATSTARLVALVHGHDVRVVDTRKTTAGIRILEKYAVRAGGGHNHRMGLYDAVMIKDNHIIAAGSITEAVSRARCAVPHTMTITVECETLDQVDEAIDAGADIVLLDNMPPPVMAEAVQRAMGRALTEASGGISESNIAEVAATGVNILSVGSLTHSAPALDMSLDLHVE